jgi:hypothetical protein
MYQEYHETGNNVPKGDPALHQIIQTLDKSISRFESTVTETRNKLQLINRHEEPSTVRNEEKRKQPETAIEQIAELLYRLEELNFKAESNLRHLMDII